MRIIHISDLHIRGNNKDNAVVREKLAGILDMFTAGDVVVATGDITDDGKEDQYAKAEVLLAPFTGRLMLVPGNHDFGRLGNFYSADCVRRFATLRVALAAETNWMFRVDGFPVGQIIGLDTCLRTGSIVDFAQGRVGFWQRTRLRWKLDEMKKHRAVSVVALHHNPYYTDWFCRLKDAKEFFEVVLGRADIVLMGHEHKERYTWYPSGLPEAQAQTRLYAAGALFREKTEPLVIQVVPPDRRGGSR
ncbi:MAG: metallophosphoesterase [bacterium]